MGLTEMVTELELLLCNILNTNVSGLGLILESHS